MQDFVLFLVLRVFAQGLVKEFLLEAIFLFDECWLAKAISGKLFEQVFTRVIRKAKRINRHLLREPVLSQHSGHLQYVPDLPTTQDDQ